VQRAQITGRAGRQARAILEGQVGLAAVVQHGDRRFARPWLERLLAILVEADHLHVELALWRAMGHAEVTLRVGSISPHQRMVVEVGVQVEGLDPVRGRHLEHLARLAQVGIGRALSRVGHAGDEQGAQGKGKRKAVEQNVKHAGPPWLDSAAQAVNV